MDELNGISKFDYHRIRSRLISQRIHDLLIDRNNKIVSWFPKDDGEYYKMINLATITVIDVEDEGEHIVDDVEHVNKIIDAFRSFEVYGSSTVVFQFHSVRIMVNIEEAVYIMQSITRYRNSLTDESVELNGAGQINRFIHCIKKELKEKCKLHKYRQESTKLRRSFIDLCKLNDQIFPSLKCLNTDVTYIHYDKSLLKDDVRKRIFNDELVLLNEISRLNNILDGY